jgi:hypothetical protein
MSDTLNQKKCSRCKENKPLDAFGKSSTARDGKQRYCKPCKLEYEKEQYQTNEAFRENRRQKALRRRNKPEEREKARVASQAWRDAATKKPSSEE